MLPDDLDKPGLRSESVSVNALLCMHARGAFEEETDKQQRGISTRTRHRYQGPEDLWLFLFPRKRSALLTRGASLPFEATCPAALVETPTPVETYDSVDPTAPPQIFKFFVAKLLENRGVKDFSDLGKIHTKTLNRTYSGSVRPEESADLGPSADVNVRS